MLRRIKAGYDWLEDGIERTLWLKLTRLALWAATIITLIIKALDWTIHSLDAFGHWWVIGGGIFVYLLVAAEEIRSRQLPTPSFVWDVATLWRSIPIKTLTWLDSPVISGTHRRTDEPL